MDIREKAEALLRDQTRTWREHIWKEHGARDAPPTIGFLIDGDDQYRHPPPAFLIDLLEQAGDDFASVIYTVLKTRAGMDNFTRFREVITILDSYGLAPGEIEEDGDPRQLEKDFQTNPASKVTEQVTLLIAADDLVGGVETVIGLMPYTISDGGEMVWSEPRVLGEEEKAIVETPILDAMQWGVLHAHEG